MRAEVYPEMSQKARARVRENYDSGRSRQPSLAPVSPQLKFAHPELRIVRTAQTAPADISADWVDYLNGFGRRNASKGVASSLGSVALVMVAPADMGRLLEQKYPAAYTDKKRVARVQKKVAESIRDFVRSEQVRLFDDATLQIETTQDLMVQPAANWDDDFLTEAFTDDFAEDDQADAALVSWRGRELLLPADAREEIRQNQALFGAMTLQAGNIERYGDAGYGLNLSANGELYEERLQLIDYLRTAEKLNVSSLKNADWQAYATVFTPTANSASAQLVAAADRPATITFDKPRAF